jgi:para-aminobenzoate synthetase/4-amino-4-deoxychorismate lyase
MDTRGVMDKEFAMAKKSNNKINNMIFKNSKGHINDALYHNIIVEISNKKYTPKISDGSLPGVYRQMLINSHNVIEKSITIDELNKASNIWFCNDVRGMVPAYQWTWEC